MSSPIRSEIKFRWAEIILTMLVSAGVSAFAVTWAVSATYTKMQMDIETIKAKQSAQDATIGSLTSQASLQSTQIAVSDANYKNILLYLSDIKEELKKR